VGLPVAIAVGGTCGWWVGRGSQADSQGIEVGAAEAWRATSPRKRGGVPE